MTDTSTTAEATVTLTVNGLTQTFTATINTDGKPSIAARSALSAAQNDAFDWTGQPLREALGETR